MFGLITGAYKEYCSRKEVSILILGIDHAGKTTLLEQMKSMYGSSGASAALDKIGPTVGLNIARLDVGRYRAIVWDLGGHVGVRSLWEKYFEEAKAVIYVVDAADAGRMTEAREALQSVGQHPQLEGKPVLILANKQDLSAARGVEQVSDLLMPERLLRGSPHHMAGVSALSCEGVREAMTWLVDSLPSDT